jgi:hypothetical protein
LVSPTANLLLKNKANSVFLPTLQFTIHGNGKAHY